MPVLVLPRADEVLDLHLLELPHPEDEVPGSDLVAEGLADLGDAEGKLPARAVQDVLEVHEDALGGLRAQIGQGGLVLHRAHVGLEHHVEVTGWGPVPGLSGGGIQHPGCGHGPPSPFRGLHHGLDQGMKVTLLHLHGPVEPPQHLFRLLLEEVVQAVALLGDAVIHHGIGEGGLVAGIVQDQAVGEDAGIQPLHVVPLVDVPSPPGLLQVVLELHPQRTVVVGPLEAPVDLGALKDKPPAFAKRHQFVKAARRHRPSRKGAWPPVRGHLTGCRALFAPRSPGQEPSPRPR
ncbi:hypothetical protein HRbin38_00218 [bacterium HR38]|nr:hypothetical protein HRbin38_00218 [bacterium HR38]